MPFALLFHLPLTFPTPAPTAPSLLVYFQSQFGIVFILVKVFLFFLIVFVCVLLLACLFVWFHTCSLHCSVDWFRIHRNCQGFADQWDSLVYCLHFLGHFTCRHERTHSHTHAHTCACAHTQTHTHTHTHKHTNTHTHTHTHTHIHTHTHTHTHSCAC